jgi:hypothetical protein
MSGLVDPLNEGVAGLLAVGVPLSFSGARRRRRGQTLTNPPLRIPEHESTDSSVGTLGGRTSRWNGSLRPGNIRGRFSVDRERLGNTLSAVGVKHSQIHLCEFRNMSRQTRRSEHIPGGHPPLDFPESFPLPLRQATRRPDFEMEWQSSAGQHPRSVQCSKA